MTLEQSSGQTMGSTRLSSRADRRADRLPDRGVAVGATSDFARWRREQDARRMLYTCGFSRRHDGAS
jgi:hypothetical protein